MTSLGRPLAADLLVLQLMMLLASSVVKATLNLTLQYEIKEDRPPGTVIGNRPVRLMRCSTNTVDRLLSASCRLL